MLMVFTPRTRAAIFALLTILAFVMPSFASPYSLRVACTILVMAVFATGINLILGFTGLMSFGHAALMGVGAYVTAKLLIADDWPFPVIMVFAVVGATLVGTLVGLTSWRVGGDYLALVTLGAGQIFYLFVNNTDALGGATGLPGIPIASVAGWQVRDVQDVYLLCLVVLIAVTLVARTLGNSSFGRALLAIREDEIVAKAHGVNVPLTKVIVFAVGSGIAGLAGALHTVMLGFVGPGSFEIDASILVVEAVLIGGMATTAGPLLGSAMIIGSTEYLRGIADYRQMIFGGLVLGILLLKPGGLTAILGFTTHRRVHAPRVRFWRARRFRRPEKAQGSS